MKLYNTLTRQIEEIAPLDGKEFKIYTCGPTVYDFQHIGNYTTAIRYDLLVRAAQVLSGYKVDYVMNLTDVGHLTSDADEGEDKLVKKAAETGKTAWDVADFYIKDYLYWLKEFNFTSKVRLLRATDYIDQQIELILSLENKGYTYTIDDGVYFDTSKFPRYSELARLDIKGLEEGSRVRANPQKHSSTDFALWKFCPVDVQRDMQWDSPWGAGFPGWHIECSAMAISELGEQIDIHGGGSDLLPVHHTNEVAQSESSTGKKFSQNWFHSGFIAIEGDKLSKSKGNGIFPAAFKERGIDGMGFRMFVMRSKYRTQSNFTWKLLKEAQDQISSLRNFSALRFQPLKEDTKYDFASKKQEIEDSINNDLNTPKAVSTLLTMTNELSFGIGLNQIDDLEKMILWLDELFGLKLFEVSDINENQLRRIYERDEAKERKDYGLADKIRDDLENEGIFLRDAENKTIWEFTSS